MEIIAVHFITKRLKLMYTTHSKRNRFTRDGTNNTIMVSVCSIKTIIVEELDKASMNIIHSVQND